MSKMTAAERLGADKGVQEIIGSDAWKHDNAGAMVADALLACARAGVSIERAVDYLEIEDDRRDGWIEYLTERYVETQAAAILGRKGGSARSEAKTKTSAANGRKGGRPKKQPE